MAQKQMALAVLVDNDGTHPSGWRLPEAYPGILLNIRAMTKLAQQAEAEKFDMLFIADTPATRTDHLEIWSRYPMFTNGLEPLTLLAALSTATSKIGLGATVSTSFFQPYNIARQFASLDHISHGRVGWNVVTSANDYAARNFGEARLPPHADRYKKARECLNLVLEYWDTWEDDAFVYDHDRQMQFEPAKFHPVAHEGAHFRAHGGLNIARAPQGHPVIIQAGASEDGKDLAAETAEVVFGTGANFTLAKAFYDDLKGRLAKFGRDCDSLKILSGITPCVAPTRAEAEDKMATLRQLIHPSVGVATLSFHLETDLSALPLDEPIPLEILPQTGNLHKAFFETLMALIRANPGITPRQLYQLYDRGVPTFCGSATELADMMQERFEGGACDGFMLLFNALPSHFDDFCSLAMPELRRRGLVRTDYTGTTLRDHLGLHRPANRRVSAPVQTGLRA